MGIEHFVKLFKNMIKANIVHLLLLELQKEFRSLKLKTHSIKMFNNLTLTKIVNEILQLLSCLWKHQLRK
jgi:hypothetical protein